jgi:hypothetical protein
MARIIKFCKVLYVILKIVQVRISNLLYYLRINSFKSSFEKINDLIDARLVKL